MERKVTPKTTVQLNMQEIDIIYQALMVRKQGLERTKKYDALYDIQHIMVKMQKAAIKLQERK